MSTASGDDDNGSQDNNADEGDNEVVVFSMMAVIIMRTGRKISSWKTMFILAARTTMISIMMPMRRTVRKMSMFLNSAAANDAGDEEVI